MIMSEWEGMITLGMVSCSTRRMDEESQFLPLLSLRMDRT